jgi:hypothetical protein
MVKIILDRDSSIINWKTKFEKSGLELTNNQNIINLITNYNINNENVFSKKNIENIDNIDNIDNIKKKQKL